MGFRVLDRGAQIVDEAIGDPFLCVPERDRDVNAGRFV
jgi:hypothetical protein